jgi:hypothetical protein
MRTDTGYDVYVYNSVIDPFIPNNASAAPAGFDSVGTQYNTTKVGNSITYAQLGTGYCYLAIYSLNPHQTTPFNGTGTLNWVIKKSNQMPATPGTIIAYARAYNGVFSDVVHVNTHTLEYAHDWRIIIRPVAGSNPVTYEWTVCRELGYNGDLSAGAGYIYKPDGVSVLVASPAWTAAPGTAPIVYLHVTVNEDSLTVVINTTEYPFTDLTGDPATITYQIGRLANMVERRTEQYLTSPIDLTGSLIPAWYQGYDVSKSQVLTHGASARNKWHTIGRPSASFVPSMRVSGGYVQMRKFVVTLSVNGNNELVAQPVEVSPAIWENMFSVDALP